MDKLRLYGFEEDLHHEVMRKISFEASGELERDLINTAKLCAVTEAMKRLRKGKMRCRGVIEVPLRACSFRRQ